MAQDEWLHVFILFLMVLEIKPRTSGLVLNYWATVTASSMGKSRQRSATEVTPQPLYWEVVGRGSTTELHAPPQPYYVWYQGLTKLLWLALSLVAQVGFRLLILLPQLPQ